MAEVASIKMVAARLRRMARTPNLTPEANDRHALDLSQLKKPNRISKQDLIIDLLRRPEGTLLTELVEVTGWLPHTARAALTGLRKRGHKVSSEKVDKVTRYRIDDK